MSKHRKVTRFDRAAGFRIFRTASVVVSSLLFVGASLSGRADRRQPDGRRSATRRDPSGMT